MKLSHTAQSGLTLAKIEGYNVTLKRNVKFWQHLDIDNRQVGPQYPTKAEALIDTNAYRERAGW